MKKKTIVFSCLAVLFLLSAFSGFSGGLVSGGIGCLVICGVFAFLAFRSSKAVTETNRETLQTSNRFTPSSNKNSFSRPAPDNAVNSGMTETPSAAPIPSNPVAQNKYVFAPIKVAGVTFNNDDGVSRQLILRKLHFHDSPFNEYADVEIKQYDFNGQPAFGVYVNNMQIGNIPSDLVPFIQENISRIESISYIDVYGGGRSKDGQPISYGCKITLRFLNDNPPVNVPDTLKINT